MMPSADHVIAGRSVIKALICWSLCLVLPHISQDAPASDEPAAALAEQVAYRLRGVDFSSRGTMTLNLANGLQRVREFSTFCRQANEVDEQVLIRFYASANIRNTGLLVDAASDGVWLFLPALKRVRRISSSTRGGRFVQSQLYYEDLQARLPSEDSHRLLEDGNYQGIPTRVLESVPAEPASSVYTKRVSWIHPDFLVPLRVDFYEGGAEPSKRLEVLRLDEIQGYWTVTDSMMTDLEGGASTRITVDTIRYDIGLAEDMFTTTALASPRSDPDLPDN